MIQHCNFNTKEDSCPPFNFELLISGCTYDRAPNAIDILQGSLTRPSYTDTGPTFLYGDSDTVLLVAFYDTLGIRRTYSRLAPRRPHGVSESHLFPCRAVPREGFDLSVIMPFS